MSKTPIRYAIAIGAQYLRLDEQSDEALTFVDTLADATLVRSLGAIRPLIRALGESDQEPHLIEVRERGY